MALFSVSQLSFYYPDEKAAALSNISLTVQGGQFIVLCGPSGSGKTTLLRHLKKSVQPVGIRSGSIIYRGVPLEQYDAKLEATEIGFVFQDPENQLVTSTVWHELAFALENVGIHSEDIRKQVAEMANFFGIEGWLHRAVHELSGGQKQLINLASILALKPQVLLLDEPTAQLDPIAAREFMQMLTVVHQELGITVICSEHRLAGMLSLADQVIVMEEGRIKYSESPRSLMERLSQNEQSLYYTYMPDIPKLYFRLARNGTAAQVPLTVKEGKDWLKRLQCPTPPAKPQLEESMQTQAKSLLECKNISFYYDRSSPPVLNKLSLSVFRSELLTVLGGNGSGKSTLIKVLAGVAKVQGGDVVYNGRRLRKLNEMEWQQNIGYLPQNPLAGFIYDTVEEELYHTASLSGQGRIEDDTERWIHFFNIRHLLNKHPYDCSGGERQKIALASTLLSKPEVLLLDEPMKGLDPYAKSQFAELLHQLRMELDLTVVIVTHDVDFAAKHATRCALLFDGNITFSGHPISLFSGNYFYTTSMSRLIRDYLSHALNTEDVLRSWKE